MSEPKWQFLEEVFLSNSISAAIGRGPGSPTYVPNPTDEQRATLGRELRHRLRDLQTRYSRTVDEQEHVQYIRELANVVSSNCASSLNGGRLRFGRSQKALNLYLKFLWCADRIPIPPHCPFDSVVIGSLPRPFLDIAWTKLDDESVYLDLVKAAKRVAGSKPLAEWELRLWQDTSMK